MIGTFLYCLLWHHCIPCFAVLHALCSPIFTLIYSSLSLSPSTKYMGQWAQAWDWLWWQWQLTSAPFLHPRWSLRDLPSDLGFRLRLSIRMWVQQKGWLCYSQGTNSQDVMQGFWQNTEAHVCLQDQPLVGTELRTAGTLSWWSQILTVEKQATAHTDRMGSWAMHCLGAKCLGSEIESTGQRSGSVNRSLPFSALLVFFALQFPSTTVYCYDLLHFLTDLKSYLHISYN